MKHGKKLTRQQRNFLRQYTPNTDNWLCVKDTSTEFVIVHKLSGEQRTIQKGES